MELDFNSYDYIIVAFSGGKDSTACVLDLLERGAPKEKMLLWHHDIDGREGSKLMDWPITRDYCRKFAEHIGIPLQFSWKKGGFEREMLRSDSLTAPVLFEDVKGEIVECPSATPPDIRTKRVWKDFPVRRYITINSRCTVCGRLLGNKHCRGCRQKFPQVTANLGQRWCTSYLKITVGCKALSNQKIFDGKRTLFITGERGEESPNRKRYKEFEPHEKNAKKRHVDHYRPVHKWKEKQVWDIIERWKIKVHPCYYLGWNRCSCAGCIFGNENQWASLNQIMPEMVKKISDYEEQFGLTIHRKHSVLERIQSGTPYQAADPDCHEGRLIRAEEFTDSVWMPVWKLPAGAFGDDTGPC